MADRFIGESTTPLPREARGRTFCARASAARGIRAGMPASARRQPSELR